MPTSFSGKPFCLAKSLQNKMGLSKGGPGGNCPGGNYPGGNCPRWELSGGNCPGGNYTGGIVRGASVQGGIVLEPCDLQAHWLLVVICK